MSLDELVAASVERALAQHLTRLPAPTSDEPDAVLNTREAAKLLHLDEETVRVEALAGNLPGRLIGRGWKFSRRALLAWLRHEALSPTPTPIALPARDEQTGAPRAG